MNFYFSLFLGFVFKCFVAVQGQSPTFVPTRAPTGGSSVNITRVCGTGTSSGGTSLTTNGVPATGAHMGLGFGVWGDTTGAFYYLDYTGVGYCRKITPDGLINTVGGGSGSQSSGSHPFLQMSLGGDYGLSGNSKYLYANNVAYILRVNSSNIASVYVGGSGGGFAGDGGPATSAKITSMPQIQALEDGTLFIADGSNNVIRKVSPAGIISTVAGAPTPTSAFGGDGGPPTSTNVKFNNCKSVYVDTNGQIFIGDSGNARIRYVNSANILNTLAGGGTQTGEGVLATNAQITGSTLWSLTGDAAGNIYFIDNNRVIHVISASSGTLSTFINGNIHPTLFAGISRYIWVSTSQNLMYISGLYAIYTAPVPGAGSSSPSNAPTLIPSFAPTTTPSDSPSDAPSANPSYSPTCSPTASPSLSPTTVAPSLIPSASPSYSPTVIPSVTPTKSPSFTPSATPSLLPSAAPVGPTEFPTAGPTFIPSALPTFSPSVSPTVNPTAAPSIVPSANPSNAPTAIPSATPTDSPSVSPTLVPSFSPSAAPSFTPSASPTANPTAVPSTTVPSASPTVIPTATPTDAPSGPTNAPTAVPSLSPTAVPSASPSVSPSFTPSIAPSPVPTTTMPSMTPTFAPTSASPTIAPSDQVKDILELSADYHFTLYAVASVSEITDVSIETILATIANVSAVISENNVEIVAITQSNIRRRERRLEKISSLSLSSIQAIVKAKSVYNLIDYPQFPAISSLAANMTTTIETSIRDGSMVQFIRELAVVNNASQLLDANITTVVFTEETIIKAHSSSSSTKSILTQQAIIGVVIGGFIFILALFVCCFFMFGLPAKKKATVHVTEEK